MTDKDTAEASCNLRPYKLLARGFGVSTRTFDRWKERDPAFPALVYVNGRKYGSDGDFETYKKTLIRRAALRRAENYPADQRRDPPQPSAE